MSALLAASLVLGLGQAQPSAKLALYPDPEAGAIVVQAFVKGTPRRSAHDAAVWEVMCNSLLEGSQELSAAQLRDYGSQAGYSPRVVVMPDYFMLEFTVPAGAIDLAGQLIETTLLRPRFRDEQVMEVTRRLMAKPKEPFYDALQYEAAEFGRIKPAQVSQLHQLCVRPENTTIIFGGSFSADQAQKEFDRRFKSWKMGRAPHQWLKEGGLVDRTKRSGRISSYEIYGNPMTLATPFSGSRMLATIALGVGKESSMFRILREEMGWSYVQEGLLWPTAKGWEPRLIMLKTGEGDAAFVAKMRELLLADIEKWDGETLARAVTLGKASLRREVPYSPFWLSASGPMQFSLSDRTAWRGYLTMIGSGQAGTELLSDALGNVDLELLKKSGKELLDDGAGRMISGS